MRDLVIRTLWMACAYFCCSLAFAQDYVDAVPPSEFYEEFDENPNVSGGQLVGLRMEGVEQWPATSAPIFFGIPDAATEICIRVASQDGLYRASNLFDIPDDKLPSLVRVPTLTKAYIAKLARYATQEVAIRAYVALSPECSPQGALNVPFLSDVDSRPDALVAYVNSGGLGVTAFLFSTDAGAEHESTPVLALAVCSNFGLNSRISYNTQCHFDLDAAPAQPALLRIDLDDGFSKTYLRFRVTLPTIGAR